MKLRLLKCYMWSMVWQKCQMKKYFREPMHQEISWRLLLTDKSNLWDTSWERVSWKRLRWPGWSKAKELEVDKGKRLWMAQGVIRLWGTMEDNDILKICQDRNEHILIFNVRVWHSTYIGLDIHVVVVLLITSVHCPRLCHGNRNFC